MASDKLNSAFVYWSEKYIRDNPSETVDIALAHDIQKCFKDQVVDYGMQYIVLWTSTHISQRLDIEEIYQLKKMYEFYHTLHIFCKGKYKDLKKVILALN